MSLMDTLRRRSSGNSQSGSGGRFQQLAPGVRMDTVTLEQALRVAEVAAREGGKVILEQLAAAGPGAGMASMHRNRVENAINKTLDECDLGFDIHNRAAKVSAWGDIDAVEPPDEELSRAPSWLVHGLCGAVSANKMARDAVISVGLAVNYIPAVGVIYDPITDEMFTARVGGPALLNGKPIEVAKAGAVENAAIVTNVAEPDADEQGNYKEHVSKTLSALMRANIYNIRLVGSPAKCLAMVAAGRACGYFECGPNPNEVCAGLVIVAAAKGHTDNIGAVVADPGSPGSLGSGSKQAVTPGCDLMARRFLCCASIEIKELLDECIAGPIPYCVVEVADSPFADDFSHADPHFAQLRAIGKVINPSQVGPGPVAEDPGKGLVDAVRWSDTPIPKGKKGAGWGGESSTDEVGPGSKPIIVPKSTVSMYSTMNTRKMKGTIFEVDDDQPLTLRGPKSRREREIELMGGTADEAPKGLSAIPQPFSPMPASPSSEAPVSPPDSRRQNPLHEQQRKERNEMADDQAGSILDNALSDPTQAAATRAAIMASGAPVSASGSSWDVDDPPDEGDSYLGIGDMAAAADDDDGYIGVGELATPAPGRSSIVSTRPATADFSHLQATMAHLKDGHEAELDGHDDGYIGIGGAGDADTGFMTVSNRLKVHARGGSHEAELDGHDDGYIGIGGDGDADTGFMAVTNRLKVHARDGGHDQANE